MALQSSRSPAHSPAEPTSSAHEQLPQPVPLRANSARMEDFLDLAEAHASTGPGYDSTLEAKRLEHERQRADQMRAFEDQMRALRAKHEEEERDLVLRVKDKSRDGPSVSAPTSPPHASEADDEQSFPSHDRSDDISSSTRSAPSHNDAKSKADDTKSMPASRRHSREGMGLAISQMRDLSLSPAHQNGNQDDLSHKLHAHQQQQQAISVNGGSKSQQGDSSMFNSFLLDDDLDANLSMAYSGKYMNMNADDDRFPILVRHGNQGNYPGTLSTASAMSANSAALDLAPLSQTPPRQHDVSRNSTWNDAKPAEWPSSGSASLNSGTRSAVTPNGSNTPVERVSPRLDLPRSTTGRHASGTHSSPGEPRRRNAAQKGYASTTELSGIPGGNPPFEPAPFMPTESYVETTVQQPGTPGFSSQFAGSQRDYVPQGYGVKSPQSGYSSVKGRREPEVNRFAGLRLEDLQGDMYALCKDQHGCRFLQKKLEEGNPESCRMIYKEIYPHFGELMTDAFGNYLAQKLFEACTDDQRDALIESLSSDLVSISLNVHGTRAVQKIIDLLSTTRQVQNLILALNLNVVTLIKDLNGNHVVQKCLNHLAPEDNQFVYNAVCANCIEVATHRHGCCVVQRSIDHASEPQRVQLVTEITYNALSLVQDAFGNYVVQYVLDLGDHRFIEAVVRQFQGNVCALSAQKFSSNVVEKCIRVSDVNARRIIIDEILEQGRIERLVRDSFANYVVQCALDYAEPAQRALLVASIRPVLPMIRNTPYGKRIQSKIQRDHEGPRSRVYHPAMSGHYPTYPPGQAPYPGPPPPGGIRSATDPSFVTAEHARASGASSFYPPGQMPPPNSQPNQKVPPFAQFQGGQENYTVPNPTMDFPPNRMQNSMSGLPSPFS